MTEKTQEAPTVERVMELAELFANAAWCDYTWTGSQDWSDDTRARRDKLRAAIEALAKDAERYRWLRDSALGEISFDYTYDQSNGGHHFELHVPFDGREINNDEESARALDEAIDTAIAKAQP